jgi:hypothetical protein
MFHKVSILVLAAFLALPAFADEPPATPTPVPKAGAKKAQTKDGVASTRAVGTANLIVTRDPDTGAIRPATAAEREKLLGRRPLVRTERPVVTLPDGSLELELGEADMAYAVASRNPDGTITTKCVPGSVVPGRTAPDAPKSSAQPTAAADR